MLRYPVQINVQTNTKSTVWHHDGETTV
jgi:hypothetical protein